MNNNIIANQKLNIYVLNWNQVDLTVDCVNALLLQKTPLETQIIIIDNGSTDVSIEIFKQDFPQIEIISNKKNLGFQGGMNAGIKHAVSNSIDFVMLLNNDTIADPEMINNLFIHLPEDAALASPAIFYHDDHDVLCSLGGDYNPILLEVMKQPIANLKLPKSVTKFEFLPSHAWLIKTEVFEEVGLLDEIFFPIYYDDLDFCLRLKRKGLPIYLIPQAKIYHRESMSVGGRNSPMERYLMARNGGFYFRKHMRFWQAPFIFLYRIGSALLWTARLAFKRNFRAIKFYWKGFYEGWFTKAPKNSMTGQMIN